MRIYLESLGCRLNYAEMAALGRQLSNAGHQLVASAAIADVCVLNSCAVTAEASRQSRQLARQMARANPSGRLVVTGCYATLAGEVGDALPDAALVVGNHRKDELFALIAELSEVMPTAADPQPPAHVPTRTRAFIKVQDGCRYRCTYCVATLARGAERSRPVATIVDEINALHAAGYQEAVLTGVHLGGYGSDLGTDLAGLLRALLAQTTIPRLRLSSLEPFDLDPAFFDLWPQSAGRLMPHLHLPLQSGSDAVLRRMARRNRVADFEALIAAGRAKIPGLTVTTDLIAGFPGETEADFAQTVALVQRIGFAHLHVFPYSSRPGTAAARFPDQVPMSERKRRVAILIALDREMGRAVRRSFIGQVRPVLWEAPVGAGVAAPGTAPVWSGLTDNYLRVQARSDHDLHNRILPVCLTGLTDDGLYGDLLVTV